MKRGGVLLTLWLVVAFTAIGVGTWALSLVGGRINDRSVQPLSQSDIQNELNNDQSTGGTPTPTPTPSDSGGGTTSTPAPGPTTGPPANVPPGGERGLRTDGGTLVVICPKGGQVYLKSWSPKPGYRADDSMQNGPADIVKFEFKSDVAEDIEGWVRCVNGVPAVTLDDSHHGGRNNIAPPAGTSSGTSGGSSGSSSGSSSTGSSGGSKSDGTASSGTSGSSGGVATKTPTATPTPTPTPSKTSGGGHGSDDPPGDDHGGR